MYNKAIMIGRLTADPELKRTSSNVSVCAFTIAVGRSYVDKDKNRETDFIDCVAWRTTAEFISKYFAKGKLIGLDGEIHTRTYEDKNKVKRKVAELIVGAAFFTESAKGTKTDLPEPPPKNDVQATPAGEDFIEIDGDDLPF
ncbi:MAG: single-stranded DNA-binding protein [Oscillospiraceae bacterium]